MTGPSQPVHVGTGRQLEGRPSHGGTGRPGLGLHRDGVAVRPAHMGMGQPALGKKGRPAQWAHMGTGRPTHPHEGGMTTRFTHDDTSRTAAHCCQLTVGDKSHTVSSLRSLLSIILFCMVCMIRKKYV